MAKVIVAYDHREFSESKNIKTEKLELDIEGAITESIIAKHIAAITTHKNIEVKDWVFGVDSEMI